MIKSRVLLLVLLLLFLWVRLLKVERVEYQEFFYVCILLILDKYCQIAFQRTVV